MKSGASAPPRGRSRAPGDPLADAGRRAEADIRLIISNHPDAAWTAQWWGIPFHHIPATPQTTSEAEAAQLGLLTGEADLVILARYMHDLRRLGRHVERAVLARAAGWHLEDRVIVHQNSTIVFS
jgi:formyltetrahydrofolate hydrolase